MTICWSRWTRYPGNCIKAVGAFAIESRGLFKQRSQREQCCYHLSAGKITWPGRAGRSFWQLHREFIQALSCLGQTLGQDVWREHWHVCLFSCSEMRACQHIHHRAKHRRGGNNSWTMKKLLHTLDLFKFTGLGEACKLDMHFHFGCCCWHKA